MPALIKFCQSGTDGVDALLPQFASLQRLAASSVFVWHPKSTEAHTRAAGDGMTLHAAYLLDSAMYLELARVAPMDAEIQ